MANPNERGARLRRTNEPGPNEQTVDIAMFVNVRRTRTPKKSELNEYGHRGRVQ